MSSSSNSPTPAASTPSGGRSFAERMSAVGRTLADGIGLSPARPALAGDGLISSSPSFAGAAGLADPARDLQLSLFAASEGGESVSVVGGLLSGSFVRGGLDDAAAIALPSVLDLRLRRDMRFPLDPAHFIPLIGVGGGRR